MLGVFSFIYVLNAFERLKRLEAVQASVKRLAGRRTKRRDALSVCTSAAGAGERLVDAEQRALVAGPAGRRGDSVGFKLAQSLITNPVGGPWRVEHGPNANIPGADKRFKRFAHVALNSFSGRAARVGGT